MSAEASRPQDAAPDAEESKGDDKGREETLEVAGGRLKRREDREVRREPAIE
jgi:hypothetical protein